MTMVSKTTTKKLFVITFNPPRPNHSMIMHYVCEPDELTCPAGDAPFELAERRKEKQRQEDMYKRKNPTR